MSAAMLAFIQLALQLAPGIITAGGQLIADMKGDATPEQNAAIDAALDKAHAELQAAQPAAG